MSRFGKITVPILLALPLSVGACGPKKGTANPEDYYPLIQVALGGGETAAMIGRNEAIKAKSFKGCVASEALITAFDSAGRVLGGKLGDAIVIPGVELDVSGCLALRDAPAAEDAGGDENASLGAPITVVTMVAGYAPAPDPEEKPPEGEPAAEEKPPEGEPAAEAAPEEKPAEEAAEEPAEEPAEEVAAFKGHPDAAVLVEALAGFTLVAVLSYATKLKSANCKKGTAALGALNYVNGMIKPIADEIAEPDGKMSIPSVTIDLSECGEG